jgi:L-lactate dehydrogenase complex protein LldE
MLSFRCPLTCKYIVLQLQYVDMGLDIPKFNHVALFVTCLVDQIYPEIGIAATRLLKRAGFEVEFPEEQTCCGQPFYNSGFVKEARRLAERTIEILTDYPAVVLPSGSCTTMIRKEYIRLFPQDSKWHQKAIDLANKTFELTEFLSKIDSLQVKTSGKGQLVTYHDSCHMSRSLGIKDQPRILLKRAGFQIVEMTGVDRCCGFGGLFSARMPEVSQAMTAEKLRMANQTKALILVSSDPGCLMQMRNLQKDSTAIQIKHIAEVLEEVTR